MSIERISHRRPYPNFRLHKLPDGEKEEAGAIRSNIANMQDRAKAFWAGKMLFQNCSERQFLDPENRPIYHQWQLCAARDCAMSIYHFGRIIEGIDESLAKCPQLRELIDGQAKRKARKKFERQFPSYIVLRHALAHSAERSKTARDAKLHGKMTTKTIKLSPEISILVESDENILLVNDNIYGTTFSSMWEGNLIKCEINDQSGEWLDGVIDDYWIAFDAIIDPNPEPSPIVTYSSVPTKGFG